MGGMEARRSGRFRTPGVARAVRGAGSAARRSLGGVQMLRAVERPSAAALEGRAGAESEAGQGSRYEQLSQEGLKPQCPMVFVTMNNFQQVAPSDDC